MEYITLSNVLIAVGVLIITTCVWLAFYYGEKDETPIPAKWRRRAQYLRWLSMSALAGMGVLVVLVVRSPITSESGSLGVSIVLGLVAAMMAGVYRYIIRLGYFYEARADAAELLKNEAGDMFNLTVDKNLKQFILLCSSLSPDGVEYLESKGLLSEFLNLKKDVTGK